MNFSNFKIVKTANERTSLRGSTRPQNFEFRFRKFISKKNGTESEEILFYISNNKFAELDLENKGLLQLQDPTNTGQVFIAVVDNDDATLMKKTEKNVGEATKGKKFKSTILEDACVAAGLIDSSIMNTNQLLDLVVVGENIDLGGVTAYKVLEIVKDTKEREAGADDSQDEDDDQPNATETTGEESVASTSQETSVEDEF